jgi:hypothetical protein
VQLAGLPEDGGCMSKKTLALGSFALGLLCASLLGRQTSTIVHADRTLAFQDQRGGITLGNKEKMPVVPKLGIMGVGESVIGTEGVVLDGLNCTRCAFTNVSFIYGGGQINCPQCSFSGNRGIELRGAALNTFNLLQQLGLLLGSPAQEQPRNPSTPKIFKTNFEKPDVLSLVSMNQQ